MPAARKWERIEDLAVLHLYRGKVARDSREVAALAAALERSPSPSARGCRRSPAWTRPTPTSRRAKPPRSRNRFGRSIWPTARPLPWRASGRTLGY